ncbi:MAG: cysteine--tRNA ligase [Pseudomonadota bacterium]
MTLKLYDSFTSEKRDFVPIDPDRVTMYVCGPTVYNYAHIGNARPPVVFDVLQRLLRRSYNLVYARNITDVDDKINQAARDTGRDIRDITDEYTEAYLADMGALGVEPPDVAPRATEHMAEMQKMIQELIDGGFAYVAEGHALFNIETFDDYGALSGRDLREMIAGARVEVAPYKKHPADFVLWKPSDDETPGWESPWGRGRPGWHLECSAMIRAHLGDTIDIHGGGQDLKFPHHENELAQSCCANDKPFVNYWLHNGFLNMQSEKMSKSLGNVKLVRELLEDADGEAIRLALLSAHYRQPLDWQPTTLSEATRKLDRLYGALAKADQLADAAPDARRVGKHIDRVIGELEDDLNTPKALAALFSMARELNKSESAEDIATLGAALRESGRFVGILQRPAAVWFNASKRLDSDSDRIETAIAERAEAKANKNYARADEIRDALLADGIQISDGPEGTTWRRIDSGSGS